MRVYTGGTFDMLHAGHMNFFRRIKKLFPECRLVVGLNTDEFVLSYKKKKPVFNYTERKQHLEWCGLVDDVIANESGADSKPTILKAFTVVLSPEIAMITQEYKIIAIGQDWLAKDYCKQMQFDNQWLTDNDISLIYVPHTDNISSSIIKERLYAN